MRGSNSGGIDYKGVGLIVGLEIHQQLATREKLFCTCPAELSEEEHDTFERRLRPTRSEMGDVDVAALFEWRKGRIYKYESPLNHSCLVEADEEPPHPLNREALVIALAIARAIGAFIPDEIHVMRKVVIDGSNTSGFQRTAIVALGGGLNVNGKWVPIQSIALEEDASRKLGEEGVRVKYRLDRLGIPLVEIATDPVIHDPWEAREVALAIGRLLRLTGRVKRGIGTIRQDLNVSIRGGAKTEIKGVQRLDLIPKVIEYEVMRQLRLLEITRELKDRGVTKADLEEAEPVDLTSIFRDTKSKVIKRALKKGGRVVGVRLKGFKGLVGRELMPGRRFGTELADYARFWAGVAGLFHSDELPGYGVTESEVERVYEALEADPERDAFVIVADEERRARKAIETVIERAKMALEGVPEETRGANMDGTTRYLRPRPGSARMYPETDIPPVEVTSELLEEADRIKPEPLEAKLKRLVEVYGLSRKMAEEVVSDERLDLIERLIEKYHDVIPAKTIASLFIVTLRGLRGEGVDVEAIDDSKIEEVVDMIARGEVAKEAVEELLLAIGRDPSLTPREAAKKLGLGRLSREEAERIIDDIVKQNLAVVRERGERAMGVLMGKAMAILRGRIDGRVVAEIVREKIKEYMK
ncbi:MAG: Glu-tRNA(Gln) amidotransferase subunit GatE [Desulfurococcales archaeon]|nr:Glu-tRNA(Gln) amidotransferase subunit GatE [Desulfurococcales archaeon]